MTRPAPAAGTEIVNAMTVDVEDYFHVSAFDGLLPRHRWDGLESRVSANTERLLDIFDPTSQTVDALMKLELPAGVDVEIKAFQK